MSQGFLHQGDQLALCLGVLPPHTGNRYPPLFLRALFSFCIHGHRGWPFSFALEGLRHALCCVAVLSLGGMVCRLHQGTVVHIGCRVSGTSPVILSTPLECPGPLGVIVQALLHLIVGTIVRESSVVAEPVGGV